MSLLINPANQLSSDPFYLEIAESLNNSALPGKKQIVQDIVAKIFNRFENDKARIASLEEVMNLLLSNRQKVNQRIDALSKERLVLLEKSEESQAKFEAIEGEKKLIVEEIAKQKEGYIGLNQELEQLTNCHSKSLEEIEISKNKINDISNRITKIRLRNRKLIASHVEHKGRIESLKSSISDLQKRVIELDQAIEEKESEAAILKKEADNLRQSSTSLQRNYEGLSLRVTQLESEKNELKKITTNLALDRTRLNLVNQTHSEIHKWVAEAVAASTCTISVLLRCSAPVIALTGIASYHAISYLKSQKKQTLSKHLKDLETQYKKSNPHSSDKEALEHATARFLKLKERILKKRLA